VRKYLRAASVREALAKARISSRISFSKRLLRGIYFHSSNTHEEDAPMKFISPKVHGYLDFAVIALLIIAPSLFKFSSPASTLCYILAVVYVAIVVFTAYPEGLVKAIPFTIHGTIELILSPLLVAMPWIAKFSWDMNGRYFFVVAGIALFFVWLFTDYKAADIAYRKKGIDLTQRGGMRGAHA
jgi:hypothetical protein